MPIFLTPAANWQPVQVQHAIIDIPIGWAPPQPLSGPGENGVWFGSLDLTNWQADAPLNDGYADLKYLEGDPESTAEAPEGWLSATVDGHAARYTIRADSNFSGVPLWKGNLRIYAPQRTHYIILRCTAPGYLGETRQRDFLAGCESLMQHWIQTTRILD